MLIFKEMLSTFPKDFSQEATFQEFFPSISSQMWNFLSGNFPSLSMLQRSVICQSSRGARPLTHPTHNAWPHCSLRCLRGSNLTVGKLSLGKLHIWEVATWEIVTWEVALGKMPLGKYSTPLKRLLSNINNLNDP